MNAAVFGEALFDLIEQPNGNLSAHIGGSPFNVARSLVKQGVNTHYLSPISNDRYGEKLYRYALDSGMQLPPQNRSDSPTSIALVYTDDSGQPDYRLYRKGIADLDISSKELFAIIPDDINFFHTGSLALVPSMVSVLKPVLERLRKKGVVISIDINMRKHVELDISSYHHAVNSLYPFADIVKVSDEDLQLLGYNGSPLSGAQDMLAELTNGMVLLTQGASGASLLTEQSALTQAVFKPLEFADAVGAGDTFFSAFLAQLIRDGALSPPWHLSRLECALEFGLMAATMNVEQIGCQPPTFSQVQLALRDGKRKPHD